MFDKIQALCKEKGISLAELERQAGLNGRTIYKWREISPSVYKVFAVAKVLGVSIEDLIAREDE